MPFTPEVLEKIEAEMKKIVKEALPLERYELAPEEAIELMEKKGETYKVELIKEHAGKGEKISFFRQGEFDELCAGTSCPRHLARQGFQADLLHRRLLAR